ncbi:MAG: hypothetical protein M1818_003918 [Claussenomyces sp. TS43310]|nr:MAG: hypothetical protein M1818_003918 [Claussenomyces sp. TS43310]
MLDESQPMKSSLAQGSILIRDTWTDDLPSTDHVRSFTSKDWSASRLGSLKQWPAALRLHAFTVFADSRPSCIIWGPERVVIYNEAFRPLAGRAYSNVMGAVCEEGFPEIWEHIKGFFIVAETTGVAADVKNLELFVERNGFLEETYFLASFNPLRGDSGKIEGFYSSIHDVTQQNLNERRTTMLNLVAQPVEQPEKGYGHHIIAALSNNPRDIPMALLYELDEDQPGRSLVRLKGQIGVPEGHKLAVPVSELDSTQGLIPLLRASRTTITSATVDEKYSGIGWQGFGEPSKIVHVLPLASGGRQFAFLIIGMNPRRQADAPYLQYLCDLSRQLSSTIASVIGTVEARKREERLGRELADSERQIRYMAKYASVGMLHMTISGTTLWANEQYYKLIGRSSLVEHQYKMSFLEIIHDDDRQNALDAFQRLSFGETLVELDIRLKRMFTPPFGEPEPAYVLVFAFPYSETGQVDSIMSCITDVSRLKWAESWQAREAQDARDAKRQQEEFVDIISHEIRNPLSAILQCADMISTSQTRFVKGGVSPDGFVEALANNVEDANTIMMCARHQKRMVDDILTMSKLDFTGLSIATAGTQLSTLVEGTVKMFEVELSASDIGIQVITEPSISENNVGWILCDPSRVTQVLVNLLTNSIKFTRVEETRNISITYGAALDNPRRLFSDDIHWAPHQFGIDDLTGDWPLEDQFFLTVTVTDTGAGMTAEEIQRLFSRFEQGSLRTSIKYGGSGLGLYISRQLTTKHGGDIGVASEPGKGSTFAFYVKARRTHLTDVSTQPLSRRLVLNPKKAKDAENTAPAPEACQARVLLVEDNVVNQKILRKQLLSSGCTVSVANHGLEALDFLRTTTSWHEQVPDARSLDIILMDVEMPVMNGLSCSQEIRALQNAGKVVGHVHIIGVTANARPEQIDLALAAGMDEVITKPFLTSDLLKRIQDRLHFATAEKRDQESAEPSSRE